MKVYNKGTRRFLVGPGPKSKNPVQGMVSIVDPAIDDALPKDVPRLGSSCEVPDSVKKNRAFQAAVEACNIHVS